MTVAATKRTTKRKAKVAAPDDGFAGVPRKTLKSLASKIVKLKAGYRMTSAVHAVAGENAPAEQIICYLVRAGLLDPMTNGYLLELLSRCELDEPTAIAIAEALARRDEAKTAMVRASSLSYFDGWEDELDQVVYRAYPLAPSAFRERAPRYSHATRLGLAFVTRRCGGEIEPALAVEVVTALAFEQARGYGITCNGGCPFIDDAGEEQDHRLEGLPELRTLALRFVTAQTWDRVLAEATKRNEWGMIEEVASAIEQLPLAEITRLFAARFSPFGDSSEADAHIAAIMDRRTDSPEELLADITVPFEYEDNLETVRAVYRAAAERKRAA